MWLLAVYSAKIQICQAFGCAHPVSRFGLPYLTTSACAQEGASYDLVLAVAKGAKGLGIDINGTSVLCAAP